LRARIAALGFLEAADFAGELRDLVQERQVQANRYSVDGGYGVLLFRSAVDPRQRRECRAPGPANDGDHRQIGDDQEAQPRRPHRDSQLRQGSEGQRGHGEGSDGEH